MVDRLSGMHEGTEPRTWQICFLRDSRIHVRPGHVPDVRFPFFPCCWFISPGLPLNWTKKSPGCVDGATFDRMFPGAREKAMGLIICAFWCTESTSGFASWNTCSIDKGWPTAKLLGNMTVKFCQMSGRKASLRLSILRSGGARPRLLEAQVSDHRSLISARCFLAFDELQNSELWESLRTAFVGYCSFYAQQGQRSNSSQS